MSTRPPYLHPVIAAGILLNFAALIAGVALYHSESVLLRQWVTEDGLVEWLQFLAFTSQSMLYGFLAADRWASAGRLRLDVLVLSGMCGLLALVALEEVSWFQRVLNLASPEFFQQHNRQVETNLHNLTIDGFNINKHILVKLFFVIGVTHNVILPLIARRRPALRERIEDWGLYLPPLSTGLIYLLFVALSQVLVDHDRRGEMGELFGSMHYLTTAFAAYALGVNYGKKPLFNTQPETRRVTIAFIMYLGFLVLMAALLGAGYLGRTPL